MRYSKFISALNCQNWTAFSGVHFMIPPSLCEQVTYVQTPFYHTFTHVQTICRSSRYGFQDFKKSQGFYNNLLKLEENIKLTPSSTEMHNHAHLSKSNVELVYACNVLRRRSSSGNGPAKVLDLVLRMDQ